MKKVIVLLSAIAVVASCSKLDKLGTFSFKRTGEFTIPATTVVGIPITLNTPGIPTSYVEEFSYNGFSVDNVEYIKATNMVVKIKAPAGSNFNFLKSVTLSVSVDGQSDIVIASKTDIQNDNVDEIEIDVNGDDLKQYIMKETFALKASAEIDEPITQDHYVEATVTFEARAKIL